MKAKLLVALVLVMGVAVGSASAQVRGHVQRERIEQGYHNGEFRGHENRAFSREQLRLRRLYQKFMRDGHLSKRERRILAREREKANRHIYRYKHNRYDRY